MAIASATNSADGGVQRVPPQSIQSEACVLGAMLLHAPAIDVAIHIAKPEYFYRPAHQLLFNILVDMRHNGKPVDLVTVHEELARLKLLDQVGGMDYVVSLVEGIPDAGNVEYYAGVVRDKAMLRALIVAGAEIAHQAYQSTQDALAVINEAENRVFQIAQNQIGQQAVPIKGLLEQTFEMLLKSNGQLLTGLGTGYTQLDELTSGLQNSEMVILAARPSMGKTSLLLNLAEHMSVVDRLPVAIFSMEMSKEQLTQRLLASHARSNLRQMRRGTISPEQWTVLQAAANNMTEAPLYIDDSPVLTGLELGAKARRLKAAYDVKCIFIDYLQLMTYAGSGSTPRHEQITEISRGIKAMARELNVPVVCAAQLNRGPTDRETHRPRMSDLRESGSIEQDADVVMLLHSEDYYHLGEPDYNFTNTTELIVAKQRNGPTGIVSLTFNKDCTRFNAAAPESIYQSDRVPV